MEIGPCGGCNPCLVIALKMLIILCLELSVPSAVSCTTTDVNAKCKENQLRILGDTKLDNKLSITR